jgi:hypothetical protein
MASIYKRKGHIINFIFFKKIKGVPTFKKSSAGTLA